MEPLIDQIKDLLRNHRDMYLNTITMPGTLLEEILKALETKSARDKMEQRESRE